MNFYRYLGARLEESANRPGIFDTERRVEGAQRLQTLTWDEARRGRAIVGTPEIVADNLASSGTSSASPASSPNSTPAA